MYKYLKLNDSKNTVYQNFCPGQVTHFVGAPSHAPKGCEFDPLLGSMREATKYVSLSHRMFLSLSLKINKHILR